MTRTIVAVSWLVGVSTLIVLTFTPDGRATVADLAVWLGAGGTAGMAAYVLLYAGATTVGLFLTWTAAVGGWLYGTTLGTVLSIPAALTGSTLAFLASRFLLRDLAAAALRRPRLAAVNDAVSRGGARMVVLLRVAPIAQNVLTAALGGTRVTLRDFVLGTLVGTAPAILLFAQAGSLAADVTQAMQTGEQLRGWSLALGIGGTVALVAAIAWIARQARASLARTREPPPP